MSITKAIAELNNATNGAYRVAVSRNSEFNVIVVKLYENTIRLPVAVGEIDCGYTKQDKQAAIVELRGLVNAYLRESNFRPMVPATIDPNSLASRFLSLAYAGEFRTLHDATLASQALNAPDYFPAGSTRAVFLDGAHLGFGVTSITKRG